MPPKKAVADIVEPQPTKEKIRIETTPTPSASEDEEGEPDMEAVASQEQPKATKSKTTKEDKETASGLTKSGRPKKPLSEARIAQLNAMKEAKKKKYDDYKESQAVLFLRDRGYAIDEKKITKELSKKAQEKQIKKDDTKTIHLKEDKPAPKPINQPTVINQQTVSAPVAAPVAAPPKPMMVRQKAYNPYAE